MTHNEGLPEIEGYRVDREIGRGGFSRVYAGMQLSVGREVALKVLNEPIADAATARAFKQECMAMGAVIHPNVVTVRDAVFTVDQRPCIVMALYSRGNYRARLAEKRTILVHELVPLGIRMAAALATTHELNIVHGDVKPANIFRSHYAEVALGDFGIATVDHGSGGTRAGGFTPHYVAPELIEDGLTAASPKSDQYSLGATLFHLASGMKPFWVPGANETDDVLLRVTTADTPVLPPPCNPELAAVIAKAMARDPLDRYSNMEGLAIALARVERQLQLRQTPIMIGTEDENTVDGLDADAWSDAGHTEASDPPQPPAPPVPPEPEPPEPEPPAPEPPAPEPEPPEPEPGPIPTGPTSRRVLLAAAGLAATAALGALAFASARPTNTGPATPTPGTTAVAFDDDFYDVVPPVTDLAGVLGPDSATFTWSSPQESLRFEVKRCDGAAANSMRTVDVPTIEYFGLSDGERPCVQVRAVVASNGAVSQWSGTESAESEGS